MNSTLPFLVEETKFLVPVIIILGISVICTILTHNLKLSFIPSFVIEIIIGIVLKQMFYDSSYKIEYNGVVEVMYSMGFIFIMFLSGYDNNFYTVKQDRLNSNNHHINIRKISIVFLILMYMISFCLSFVFLKSYDNNLLGIILLTIAFSSTFAGVVIPLLKEKEIMNTMIGKLITYLSTISELVSIVLLTVFMIFIKFNIINLTGYILLLLLFLLVWGLKKIENKSTEQIKHGFTHITIRIIIICLSISVILCEFSGGEYVLGAFLLGIMFKKINFDEEEISKIESICYGIFTPIFFVLVGTKLDVRLFVINPKWLLVVIIMVIMFIVNKLPLLYLNKWFKNKTTLLTVVLLNCTLIVGLAVSHLGVKNQIFSEQFGECIIFSSIITCIISSIAYEKIMNSDKIKNIKVMEERKYNS